jgi:hypothetical protein
MIHVGITIVDRGSAIVHVDRDGDELLVTAVERLPFDLDAVAARVHALDDALAEVTFVIDADGLGQALWAVLGPPEDDQRWQLYAGRGVERQALVDRLLVAIHAGVFHFAPALPEQAAMSKALQTYRRQVHDDGIVGSELVVALLLALIPPPPPPVEPWFYWGPSLFGPPDPFDGTRVGDMTMRRGPDGRLYGALDAAKETT